VAKLTEVFTTRFISAQDLQRATPPFVFTIKDTAVEEGVNPKTREKQKLAIVYFEGAMKGYRVRKSEHIKLIQKLGDDMDAWPGTEVELYVVDTQVGKGVRMKVTKGQTK